jgi:hypothetical protein
VQYMWDSSSSTWISQGTSTGVTSGCYGSGTSVPTYCVDSAGRLISAADVSITDYIKTNNSSAYNSLVWPAADGSSGYVLSTNGSGTLSWIASTSTAGGTVTSVSTGTGLTGGPITTSGTINLSPATTSILGGVIADGATIAVTSSGVITLAASGATANSYTNANVTVDTYGRITSASNGTVNAGTVTSIVTGTGLTGGPITSAGTISLSTSGATGGSYTYPNITIDNYGRVTAITSNTTPTTGTVTSVDTGTGLTGGPITSSGTLSLSTSGATAGSYTNTSLTVDTYGRITTVASGTAYTGTVSSIVTGTGITGGPITTTGTLSLATSGVTAGSYTNTSFTVDTYGRLTSASSGTGGGTVTSVTAGSGLTASPVAGITTTGSLGISTGGIIDTMVSATAAIQSSKLSFTQSGTGAVARTIDSIFKEYISVKDYGAVGDGVTDDTTAIQAAFTYASGKQIGIYVPGGRYLVTSALTLNVTGSTSNAIWGDGNGVSVIMLNTGGNGININYSGNWWLLDVPPGSTACAFRDLTFTTTDLFVAGSKCLAFEGVSVEGRPARQTIIQNVEFQGFNNFQSGWATQLWLHDVGDFIITCCHFVMGQATQGDGITWSGTAQANSPTEVRITACSFIYGDRGIYLTGIGTEGIYIVNTDWVGTNYGIYVDVAAESGVHLSNGHMNCYKRCVYLNGMIGGTISGVLFYQNVPTTKTEKFVAIELLGNSSEFTIIGNQFAGSGVTTYADCAIYLGANAAIEFTNYISGNIFENWFSPEAAIVIDAACKRVNIGPNAFNNCVQNIRNAAAALAYAVSIDPVSWSTVVTKTLTGGSATATIDITIPTLIFGASDVPNSGSIGCSSLNIIGYLQASGTTNTNAQYVIRTANGANITAGTYTFYTTTSRIYTTYG